jgi:hypothetical protein
VGCDGEADPQEAEVPYAQEASQQAAEVDPQEAEVPYAQEAAQKAAEVSRVLAPSPADQQVSAAAFWAACKGLPDPEEPSPREDIADPEEPRPLLELRATPETASDRLVHP